MYPVVIGNGRQLTKDTVICGYNIPKGVSVDGNIIILRPFKKRNRLGSSLDRHVHF